MCSSARATRCPHGALRRRRVRANRLLSGYKRTICLCRHRWERERESSGTSTSGLSTTPLTGDDVIVLAGQVQSKIAWLHSSGRRCKYGFPQAVPPLDALVTARKNGCPLEEGSFCAVVSFTPLARGKPKARSTSLIARLKLTRAATSKLTWMTQRALFGNKVVRALSLESRRWGRDRTDLLKRTGVAAQSPSKSVAKWTAPAAPVSSQAVSHLGSGAGASSRGRERRAVQAAVQAAMRPFHSDRRCRIPAHASEKAAALRVPAP